MANQYTSYYLEQQYESRDGGVTFFPTTPNVFRRSSKIKEENDENCGYIPPHEPLYKWVEEDIKIKYICDIC